ncbi:Zfp294 protein [Thecamonas trahens ATCC 50062]|uniref:E3 ubiquitin-protein ligase listerin n=1 Tax=Thecamonas trahens ATCC 50062 TaxID=461836 RepID=A0A0L0DSM8_THETB|nr:Zfp294 protein [Thecamonas trahens ATCC 50062]KNC54458.1 Zfp294 protein [Thecamonas trahens ATCC 50062]|eukprot:XP_013753613.1 Zfp294 protein [Thecamonas trahens ATCC 50062]
MGLEALVAYSAVGASGALWAPDAVPGLGKPGSVAYEEAAAAYVALSWRLVLVSELTRMLSFEMVFSEATDKIELGGRYVTFLTLSRLHTAAAAWFEERGEAVIEYTPAPTEAMALTGPGSKGRRPDLVLESCSETASAAGESEAVTEAAAVAVARLVGERGLGALAADDAAGVVAALLEAARSDAVPLRAALAAVLVQDHLGRALASGESVAAAKKMLTTCGVAWVELKGSVDGALASAGATRVLTAVIGFVAETVGSTREAEAFRAAVAEPLFAAVAGGGHCAASHVLAHGLLTADLPPVVGSGLADLCLAHVDNVQAPALLAGLLGCLGEFKLLGSSHERIQSVLASAEVEASATWKAVARYTSYARRVGETGEAGYQAWAQGMLGAGLRLLRKVRKVALADDALQYVPLLPAVNAGLAGVLGERGPGSLVAAMGWEAAAVFARKADVIFGLRRGEDREGTSLAAFEALKAVYSVASRLVVDMTALGKAAEAAWVDAPDHEVSSALASGKLVVEIGRGVMSRLVTAREVWGSGQRAALLGQLLAWQLVLDHANAADSSERQRRHVTDVLGAFSGSVRLSLSLAFAALSTSSAARSSEAVAAARVVSAGEVAYTSSAVLEYAAGRFVETLVLVPRIVRDWWTGCSREDQGAILAFVARRISPVLIGAAMDEVVASREVQEADALKVTVARSKGVVNARYEIDEMEVGLTLSLPEAYPLQPVVIEAAGAHKGIAKSQWRRWMLSLRAMLDTQLASLTQVVLHWKSSLARRFEGVDECPICYYVLHFGNHSLPSMPCSVCKQKFHAACLYTWFAEGGNSSCPMCRSPF